MQVRIQKFIASTGVTSRRKAEDLIRDGRVFVNKKKVREMGMLIDPAIDVVVVDGKYLEPVTSFRYVAVNKPVGIISTRAHHPGEQTIYGIVPESTDLVIAGRLDKDSEGLMLLTNDGAFVNELTHPKYQHEKEYEITTTKAIAPSTLSQLKSGIELEEGTASFDSIKIISETVYRVTLHQGWKRQIRRMMSEVHHHVNRLVRVRMGKLAVGDLKPGEWREVKKSDIL